MPSWSSDAELCQLIRSQLYTPVVGDILDQHGRYHQFLPPQIHPLRTEFTLVGRAMPALVNDVYGPQKKPFGLLTESLDQLEAGEVYIASGGAMRCAYWGEILTATAKARGAAGAVVNGYHRDTPKVLEQEWPVFSRGRFAQDSSVRSQIADFRCPIEVGNVRIHPGDLVFADLDGVLIIPQELIETVIEASLEKAQAENLVRQEIEQNGMSSGDAFRKYGVL